MVVVAGCFRWSMGTLLVVATVACLLVELLHLLSPVAWRRHLRMHARQWVVVEQEQEQLVGHRRRRFDHRLAYQPPRHLELAR